MLICSVPSIALAEVTQLELPQHTHTFKHATTSHLFSTVSVHAACVRRSKKRRSKNTSNSGLSLFLSLLHPLLSLSAVLKHILFTERISASPTLCTLSLSLFIPPLFFFVLFICMGHAFLINHFHSFIYLFFCGSFFPFRFQALISRNLLAWHTNESEREKRGRVKYKTLIISCYLKESVCICA